MHLPGPSNALFWPQQVDECRVPFQQILCKIETPTAVIGKSYSITPECNVIMNAYTDEH